MGATYRGHQIEEGNGAHCVLCGIASHRFVEVDCPQPYGTGKGQGAEPYGTGRTTAPVDEVPIFTRRFAHDDPALTKVQVHAWRHEGFAVEGGIRDREDVVVRGPSPVRTFGEVAAARVRSAAAPAEPPRSGVLLIVDEIEGERRIDPARLAYHCQGLLAALGLGSAEEPQP